MRSKFSVILFVGILLFSMFIPCVNASSTTKSGDLLLSQGPWHVGDEVDFSILVHNEDSAPVSVYLQLQIDELIINGSVFQIEPDNVEEIVMSYESVEAGKLLVNWSVIEILENHTKSISGSEEIIIYQKQSLKTKINSIVFDSSSGYSIDWEVNLSIGNPRLVDSTIYFISGDEMIIASEIRLNLNPGMTFLNTILGFAPTGSSMIEIILTPHQWSSSSIATDIENIESDFTDFKLTIESNPTPLNPTLGDTVEITIKLTNNGILELDSGKIIAIDGQKRILGEFSSPVISSENEIIKKIKIDEWMSTSTTSLELIWIVESLLVRDSLEVVSSNSDEIVPDSNFSIDWFSIFSGIGIGLLVIFSVRIISARNEIEGKVTKNYSQKNQKIEEKSETTKRTIQCKECNKKLQVPIDYNGQVKCPSCLIMFSTKIETLPKIEEDEEFSSSSDSDVIECPKCDQVLRVPYEKRPAKARCPACKCIFNALAE